MAKFTLKFFTGERETIEADGVGMQATRTETSEGLVTQSDSKDTIVFYNNIEEGNNYNL